MLSLESEALEEAREEALRYLRGGTDDDSPGGGAAVPEGQLDEVVDILRSDVESLMDLGPRLDEPLKDFFVDEEAAWADTRSHGPVQIFGDNIRAKYPRCDESLVAALSKANYETMMRLIRERDRASISRMSKSPLLAAMGRQLAKSQIDHDSALGSSLPTTSQPHDTDAMGSSYARTVASFKENGVTRTRIPPQPKDVEVGQPFPCPACGKLVFKSRRPEPWK